MSKPIFVNGYCGILESIALLQINYEAHIVVLVIVNASIQELMVSIPGNDPKIFSIYRLSLNLSNKVPGNEKEALLGRIILTEA